MSSKKPLPQLFVTLIGKDREERMGTNWSLKAGERMRGSNNPTGKYTVMKTFRVCCR